MFFLLYKSGATSGWITLVLTTLRFKTQAKKQKCNQSERTDMTLPKCKLNMNDSKAPQRRKHKLFVQLTNFTGNVMENYCRESIAPFDLIFQMILILFFMSCSCFSYPITLIYYININEIPGELCRENMISSHTWKDHCYYGYIINCAFRSKIEMLWYIMSVYIINRTLHGRLEIRNFSSHVEKYFTHSLCSLMKYFQHSKRNFVSPHRHVISSMYVYARLY